MNVRTASGCAIEVYLDVNDEPVFTVFGLTYNEAVMIDECVPGGHTSIIHAWIYQCSE